MSPTPAETIDINLADHATRLVVGRGTLNMFHEQLRQISPPNQLDRPAVTVIVTDDNVGPIYEDRLVQSFTNPAITNPAITNPGASSDSIAIDDPPAAGAGRHRPPCHRIPAGESSKSIQELQELYRFFAESKLDRNGTVIALGGGVVSDLAGFAAATWMRGVRFAICPTTLESDVDACLGGKTAINLPAGKNLVGAFHQPDLIVVDTACLDSLPDRDFRAALAESVKHALIRPGDFLDWHVANLHGITTRDPGVTTELVRRNLETKASFIQQDPNETAGSRIMLNFGHTIGHAVENAADYRLRHGECVALGMLAALKLSELTGLLDPSLRTDVKDLLAKLNLPTRISDNSLTDVTGNVTVDFDQIADTIRLDKKSRHGATRFVLLSGAGQPVVVEDVPPNLVRDAFESIA